MAKKYMGVATLTALMEILKEYLGQKVNVEDIVTTLQGYESAKGKVASPELVQELKTKVDGIMGEEGVAKAEDAEKLGGKDPSAYVLVENVIDTLANITGAEDVALAGKIVGAKAVKELYNSLSGLIASGAVSPDDVITDLEDYTPEDDDGKVAGAGLVKELQDQVDTLQSELTTFKGTKGKENGLAELDGNGKVKSDQLPSYVDDVIEGFYDSDEGEFYEPEEDDENEDGVKGETKIEPEKGIIYVDLATNKSYRWSGSAYIEVCSSDMVEITDDEVEEIWEQVLAELAAEANGDDGE